MCRFKVVCDQPMKNTSIWSKNFAMQTTQVAWVQLRRVAASHREHHQLIYALPNINWTKLYRISLPMMMIQGEFNLKHLPKFKFDLLDKKWLSFFVYKWNFTDQYILLQHVPWTADSSVFGWKSLGAQQTKDACGYAVGWAQQPFDITCQSIFGGISS